jgi:sulfur-oxidizing protein SoxX
MSGDRCAIICAGRVDQALDHRADETAPMTIWIKSLVFAVVLVSPAAGQAAAPLVTFKIVVTNGMPTIPVPLTDTAGDPKRGEQVVIERRLGNCLSCHEMSALRQEEFHGEIGPSLDGVAKRLDIAALRLIVVNPKQVFGDATVMPAFYRVDGFNRVRPEFAGKPILTAQQVEDVVAYLTTLK